MYAQPAVSIDSRMHNFGQGFFSRRAAPEHSQLRAREIVAARRNSADAIDNSTTILEYRGSP